MNVNDVKPGLKVRITKLGETIGYLVNDKHLTCRREGQTGVVGGYIPGHGGDVYWVSHDNGTEVGAYAYDEFEPVDTMNEPKVKPPKVKLKVKPITPEEVAGKKLGTIPDEVIQAFNELITENFKYNQAHFTGTLVFGRIRKIFDKTKTKEPVPSSHDIVENGWLDVEPIFQEAGWIVGYEKPGYNETGEAIWTFTKKTNRQVL